MGRSIEELEYLVRKYEENGPAKLYYSVNRKSWEIADLLNKIKLEGVTLDDAKDKTFDRLRGLLKDSSDIAITVKTLGDIAGITGNEDADVKKKKAITPQSIAKGEFE